MTLYQGRESWCEGLGFREELRLGLRLGFGSSTVAVEHSEHVLTLGVHEAVTALVRPLPRDALIAELGTHYQWTILKKLKV